MEAKVGRGASTRDSLLDTAENLFAEQGYDATSIEQVLSVSGVSRGAVYYHFKNKEALFSVVLERVEQRVARTVALAGGGATNPLDALRDGCRGWLDLATDPVVRRIVLIDAPTVVGWQAWRAIDDRYALGLLKAALGAAAAAGRFSKALVDVYAHVLLAALIELSLLIAQSPADESVKDGAREALETLICGLLGIEAYSRWNAIE